MCIKHSDSTLTKPLYFRYSPDLHSVRPDPLPSPSRDGARHPGRQAACEHPRRLPRLGRRVVRHVSRLGPSGEDDAARGRRLLRVDQHECRQHRALRGPTDGPAARSCWARERVCGVTCVRCVWCAVTNVSRIGRAGAEARGGARQGTGPGRVGRSGGPTGAVGGGTGRGGSVGRPGPPPPRRRRGCQRGSVGRTF